MMCDYPEKMVYKTISPKKVHMCRNCGQYVAPVGKVKVNVYHVEGEYKTILKNRSLVAHRCV